MSQTGGMIRSKTGHLHYLHFWWKLVKASMEASVEDMEASTTSTEASIASMEAFMEDSVGASSLEASTKTVRGRNFHGSFHAS